MAIDWCDKSSAGTRLQPFLPTFDEIFRGMHRDHGYASEQQCADHVARAVEPGGALAGGSRGKLVATVPMNS